jgi:hypothetical protein
MATNDAKGFTPARHLAGGQIRTRRYFVTVSGNALGLAKGDSVRLNPNGEGIVRTSGDVVPTVPVLGAVVALYDVNNKPLTFSQPTRGAVLPASTAGYADVVDDPFVTFIVQADTTVTQAHIGQFVSVTAGTNGMNTAAGTSNMQVKMSTADTSVRQYQIIGVAFNEETGLGSILGRAATDVSGSITDGTCVDVEVIAAAHWAKGSIGTTVAT